MATVCQLSHLRLRSEPQPVEIDSAVSALAGEVGIFHPFEPLAVSRDSDAPLRFVDTVLSDLDSSDVGRRLALGIVQARACVIQPDGGLSPVLCESSAPPWRCLGGRDATGSERIVGSAHLGLGFVHRPKNRFSEASDLAESAAGYRKPLFGGLDETLLGDRPGRRRRGLGWVGRVVRPLRCAWLLDGEVAPLRDRRDVGSFVGEHLFEDVARFNRVHGVGHDE